MVRQWIFLLWINAIWSLWVKCRKIIELSLLKCNIKVTYSSYSSRFKAYKNMANKIQFSMKFNLCFLKFRLNYINIRTYFSIRWKNFHLFCHLWPRDRYVYSLCVSCVSFFSHIFILYPFIKFYIPFNKFNHCKNFLHFSSPYLFIFFLKNFQLMLFIIVHYRSETWNTIPIKINRYISRIIIVRVLFWPVKSWNFMNLEFHLIIDFTGA
jgi:hypothetical protein